MVLIQPQFDNNIAPGAYPAKIEDAEEIEGKYGPQVMLTFRLLDPHTGEETDYTMRGYCSAKWGPRTKLYDWSTRVLKTRCPRPNEAFDTDMLVGKKCDILVERREGELGPRSVVSTVYPYRSMSTEPEEVGETNQLDIFA